MKLTIGIAVALAVIAGLFLFFYSDALFQQNGPLAPVAGPTGTNLYANGAYGISFPYPSEYVVQEGERSDRPHDRYAIVLIHEDDVEVPIAGEGPTSITIDIYENTTNETLSNWVTTASESNYMLGDQRLTEMSVDGKAALQFRWSGLYEGETTAFLNGDTIVVVSVTYLTPEDAIIADYRTLLSEIQLAQ